MKRTLCLFIAFAALLCAFSCTHESEPKKTDIRKTAFSQLCAFYEGKHLESFLEAASLYAAGKDLVAYDCEGLLDESKSDAEYVLAYCFLKKSGHPLAEGIDIAGRCEKLASAAASPAELSTRELFLTLAAIKLSGCGADFSAIADDLISRQDEISGGSYEYPQSGGVSHISPENTAFSLMAYMTVRDDIRTAVLEDRLHDSALLYLGECIREDNTVLNADGVSSSVATARVLEALIICGVPQNGEISTSLTEAISRFFAVSNGVLYGCRATMNAEAEKSTASELLFCMASTLYGNPLVPEKQISASGTEKS